MPQDDLCPICGQGKVTEHTEEYEGRKGLVVLHYLLCDTCGCDFVGRKEMSLNKSAPVQSKESADKQ
jgi:HTH-type transcriptional regulator/antitoxin MqsA